jgi:PmbA protein
MNINDKYTLADKVIARALKSGAQQVSVSIYESRNNDIEIRDQQIDRLKESNRNSMSIGLYVDNKYSSHNTNRLKEEDLFRFTEEGVAATRFLAVDKFRALPDPSLYYKGGDADLKIFDQAIDLIQPKAKIDLAMQVLNEAYKKDERIISVSSYYSDSQSNRVLVTSNGFRGTSAGTSVSLSASVAAKSGDSRPSDYWYETSLFFDNLIRDGIGKKALERTLKKIGPKKIKSGKYTMVVDNMAIGNLAGPFNSALQGYSIDQKQSFLAGKAGKKVASDLMTVYDDPLIISGPGSRLFDDEGLAAVKRPIVEDGILKNFYIDTYYSRKLGMDTTTGSTSNVIFKLGTRDLAAMLASVKKGILVTGFNGGNCNGSTGDFSYGIDGYLIENGAIVHPVNEMNISGNMNEFWMKLIEAGNDIREGDAWRLPSMMFDGIDFSGI